MHRTTLRSAATMLVASLLVSLPGVGTPRAETSRRPGDRFAVPGRLIVKFRQDPGPISKARTSGIDDFDRVLGRHAVQSIDPIAPRLRPAKAGGTDLSRLYVVRYGDGAVPEMLAAKVARLAQVEYAEPQWAYWTTATPNDVLWTTSQSLYHNRMQLPAAWDIVKGNQGSVVVAVVDGGTEWRHNDLVANIWVNPDEVAGNGIDDDGNDLIDDVRGWRFDDESADPTGFSTTPTSAGHGTHVAGIIGAVANNALLIAGASWNAKVMPINAALEGTQFDGTIGYGYAGILYAVEQGADIINCSWGGSGSPSIFELEVVNYATEQGSAIVAAAGNRASAVPHYPSSYRPVLSVVNVNNVDVRANDSNYGPDVDVCAQGTSIRSTVPGNAAGNLSGTSMASPHAAAVAALVKTKWPHYTALQVLQTVRVTADDIDAVNPSFAGGLGFGRVNALRALSVESPAIRISDVRAVDADLDGTIEADEDVTLQVTVTNYLTAAQDIAFELSDTSPLVTVVQNSAVLTALGTLESRQLSDLRIHIAPGTPVNTTLTFTLGIDTGSHPYADTDRFVLTVSPVVITHAGNNITTSVTSVGRLGFSSSIGGNGMDGVGFAYKNGPNLMFEGALMIGDRATRVVDAARGGVINNEPVLENEFTTAPNGSPKFVAPILADEVSEARFNDTPASLPMNLEVFQQSFQFAAAPDDDYILLKYTLSNTGTGTLNNVRVGWYFDWDVDATSFNTNRTGFDATRGLGYVWDDDGGANGVYVGMMVLNGAGTTAFRGVYNNHNDPRNPSWGVYDGFPTAEKWEGMSSIVFPAAGPADISTVIAAGPLEIVPGGIGEVAFAFLCGDNLADLQANADAARAKWSVLDVLTPIELTDFTLEQDGRDVVVRWRTEHEQDVAAFRVLRARDAGAFAPVGADLAPNTTHAYELRDAAPDPGRYAYRIAEISRDGSLIQHAWREIEVTAAAAFRSFLAPNSPNPFNPVTTLRYGLAHAGPARLAVYDGRGHLVRLLLQEHQLGPGEYVLTWDGRDQDRRALPSGVYVARLELDRRVFVQRMTLLK